MPAPPSSASRAATSTSSGGSSSSVVSPNRSRNSKPVPYRNGRPGRVRAAQLDDEPPVEQRPDRVVRVDATDPLDRGLRHRLAVGDDRERLERRRREADGVRADVAGDERAGVRRRDQLDAVARQDEPDPAARAARPRGRRGARRPSRGRRRRGPRSRGGSAAARRRTAAPRAGPRSARRRRAAPRRRPPAPSGRRCRALARVDHANDSRLSIGGRRPAPSAAAAVPRPSSPARRSGPTARPGSTTISRRFTSSSIARNVTATTTRSRTPRSRSWSTIEPAPDAGSPRG